MESRLTHIARPKIRGRRGYREDSLMFDVRDNLLRLFFIKPRTKGLTSTTDLGSIFDQLAYSKIMIEPSQGSHTGSELTIDTTREA